MVRERVNVDNPDEEEFSLLKSTEDDRMDILKDKATTSSGGGTPQGIPDDARYAPPSADIPEGAQEFQTDQGATYYLPPEESDDSPNAGDGEDPDTFEGEEDLEQLSMGDEFEFEIGGQELTTEVQTVTETEDGNTAVLCHDVNDETDNYMVEAAGDTVEITDIHESSGAIDDPSEAETDYEADWDDLGGDSGGGDIDVPETEGDSGMDDVEDVDLEMLETTADVIGIDEQAVEELMDVAFFEWDEVTPDKVVDVLEENEVDENEIQTLVDSLFRSETLAGFLQIASSALSKSIDPMDLGEYEFQYKGRFYVSDIEKAPEDADVKYESGGGLYYEAGDSGNRERRDGKRYTGVTTDTNPNWEYSPTEDGRDRWISDEGDYRYDDPPKSWDEDSFANELVDSADGEEELGQLMDELAENPDQLPNFVDPHKVATGIREQVFIDPRLDGEAAFGEEYDPEGEGGFPAGSSPAEPDESEDESSEPDEETEYGADEDLDPTYDEDMDVVQPEAEDIDPNEVVDFMMESGYDMNDLLSDPNQVADELNVEVSAILDQMEVIQQLMHQAEAVPAAVPPEEVENAEKEREGVWITADGMEKVCPPCAEKMRSRGIRKLRISDDLDAPVSKSESGRGVQREVAKADNIPEEAVCAGDPMNVPENAAEVFYVDGMAFYLPVEYGDVPVTYTEAIEMLGDKDARRFREFMCDIYEYVVGRPVAGEVGGMAQMTVEDVLEEFSYNRRPAFLSAWFDFKHGDTEIPEQDRVVDGLPIPERFDGTTDEVQLPELHIEDIEILASEAEKSVFELAVENDRDDRRLNAALKSVYDAIETLDEVVLENDVDVSVGGDGIEEVVSTAFKLWESGHLSTETLEEIERKGRYAEYGLLRSDDRGYSGLWKDASRIEKPFTGPEGQEFSGFNDCVDTIQGDGTTEEEAKKICGKWQAESEGKSFKTVTHALTERGVMIPLSKNSVWEYVDDPSEAPEWASPEPAPYSDSFRYDITNKPVEPEASEVANELMREFDVMDIGEAAVDINEDVNSLTEVEADDFEDLVTETVRHEDRYPSEGEVDVSEAAESLFDAFRSEIGGTSVIENPSESEPTGGDSTDVGGGDEGGLVTETVQDVASAVSESFGYEETGYPPDAESAEIDVVTELVSDDSLPDVDDVDVDAIVDAIMEGAEGNEQWQIMPGEFGDVNTGEVDVSGDVSDFVGETPPPRNIQNADKRAPSYGPAGQTVDYDVVTTDEDTSMYLEAFNEYIPGDVNLEERIHDFMMMNAEEGPNRTELAVELGIDERKADIIGDAIRRLGEVAFSERKISEFEESLENDLHVLDVIEAASSNDVEGIKDGLRNVGPEDSDEYRSFRRDVLRDGVSDQEVSEQYDVPVKVVDFLNEALEYEMKYDRNQLSDAEFVDQIQHLFGEESFGSEEAQEPVDGEYDVAGEE